MFCLCIKNPLYLHRYKKQHGDVAQLNSASDYGSEGCRFESCHRHKMIKWRRGATE